MSTTVDTLANEVADEFGEEYTDLDVAEQFKSWVKEHVRRVYSAARWFAGNAVETITLSNATSVYSLSSTASEIKSVRAPVGNKKLSYTSVERMIARDKDLESTGTPTNWWYEGLGSSNEVQLRVWPIPTTTSIATEPSLQVWVQKRPPSLGDSDTIPLPDEFIDVIRQGVRMQVRLNENNLEAAGLLSQQYQEGLMLLLGRFSKQPKVGSTLAGKQKFRTTHQAPGADDGG
jgi:hypothetical protein